MVFEPPKKRQRAQGKGEDESKNEYIGFVVPVHNYKIPEIRLSDEIDDDLTSSSDANRMTPIRFYQEYIRLRKPVIIKGFLKTFGQISTDSAPMNSMFKIASELIKIKELDYLKSQVGEEKVKVEKRSSQTDSFGRGTEIEMTFEQFIHVMEQTENSEMYYLTTQDVDCTPDGRPHLLSPFMRKIFQKKSSTTINKDDSKTEHDGITLPLQPELMGNLIPQNINLWLGKSLCGASSGLHHDYHDNLYMVLRGKKEFRIYSPDDIENMYPRGLVHGPYHVHTNGRINYFSDPTTAYGADLQSDKAAEAEKMKTEAERLLKAAEEDLEAGIIGAQERLELAESMLEEAMDAMIDVEMDGEADGKEASWIFGTEDDEYEEDAGEDDDGNDDSNESDDFDGDDEDGKVTFVDKTVKNPDNFSQMDSQILNDQKELKSKYPKFLNAKAAFCHVEEGDMLYLPASWFHEVTSMGGLHMAINYWFHPPDAPNNFEKPYTSDFWTNDFKLRSI